MSELRMGDVNLIGCEFTLIPAARKEKVDENFMLALLDAAEYKFSCMRIRRLISKKSPRWPQLYSKTELLHNLRNVSIADLIDADLITPASDKTNNENYFLTKRALDIFLIAKRIDEKLKRKNPHYRLCCIF